MRERLRRLADWCTDRLTVQERWLVLAFLGIVVLGSVVKYSRARPERVPVSPVAPGFSPPPAPDDPP